MQSKGNVLFGGVNKIPWLRYSFSKDAVFSSSCVIFNSKASRDKTVVSTPSLLNDWSSIHNYIKRQEVRVFHIAS